MKLITLDCAYDIWYKYKKGYYNFSNCLSEIIGFNHYFISVNNFTDVFYDFEIFVDYLIDHKCKII